jgi:hypothetical protein
VLFFCSAAVVLYYSTKNALNRTTIYVTKTAEAHSTDCCSYSRKHKLAPFRKRGIQNKYYANGHNDEKKMSCRERMGSRSVSVRFHSIVILFLVLALLGQLFTRQQSIQFLDYSMSPDVDK